MKKILFGIISAFSLLFIIVICFSMFNHKNDSSNILNIRDELSSGRYDYNEGNTAMDKSDYQKAEKHYYAVLKLKNTIDKEVYINALVNLGICCVKQGKTDLAKKHWQEAADLGDKSALENLKTLNSKLANGEK